VKTSNDYAKAKMEFILKMMEEARKWRQTAWYYCKKK
jgi:hypothetical protein